MNSWCVHVTMHACQGQGHYMEAVTELTFDLFTIKEINVQSAPKQPIKKPFDSKRVCPEFILPFGCGAKYFCKRCVCFQAGEIKAQFDGLKLQLSLQLCPCCVYVCVSRCVCASFLFFAI